MYKKTILGLLAILAFSNAARAEIVLVSGLTATWRVENYSAQGVNLWFTPSNCPSGRMTLPANATVADHNRLFAMVMAAKLANAPMFIQYYNNVENCPIYSFGMGMG